MRNDSPKAQSSVTQFTKAAAARRKRPAPLSIRISDEERAQLKEAAGNLSLNAYVRSRLFGNRGPEVTRAKAHDLAQVLGKLGQSHLAGSFRDLAEAARIGALPVTPETESSILMACVDVAAMKSALMSALGTREH